MTTEELLEKIIIEIEKLGIELKTGELVGAVAYISPKEGWGIWDRKRSTLFDLTHEYIHAKYGDYIRYFEHDCNSPHERRANKEAILLLWNYFEKCGGITNDLSRFIELTGCPEKLTKIIVLQSKIKDWSREEIPYQVYSYLDKTDEEPETWNLYQIMAACNIDSKWEQLVNKTIKEYYFNHFQSGRVG